MNDIPPSRAASIFICLGVRKRKTVGVAQADAEDILFLFDASRSMNEKVGKEGRTKFGIVKEGMMDYIQARWPLSYYPWPTRVGIVAFRLLGTPGNTKFEELVPLYPEPVSIELWRLRDLGAKGGAILGDALQYGIGIIRESSRGKRTLVLVGDGGDDGDDPREIAGRLPAEGVGFECIEVSNASSPLMLSLAERGKGEYHLVGTLAEFEKAVGGIGKQGHRDSREAATTVELF